jgi:hypothetical protein
MAVNVYLVFYMRFDPNCFKRWWWLYCMICYGGPFTIAMTLLFIRDESRGGPVYGEAEVRKPPERPPFQLHFHLADV